MKLARDAREVSGRDVFIAGSIGPLGDVARTEHRTSTRSSPSRPSSSRAAASTCSSSRRSTSSTSSSTAIAAVRSVSSLPIVALLTFDEDAHDARRRVRGATRPQRWPTSTSPRSARTTASARRRRSARSSRCATDGKPLAVMPNVGLASLAGRRIVFPHATPEYFGGLRGPRAGARRAHHRRLLRDDADRDRRDPRAPSTSAAARGRRSSRASASSSSPPRRPRTRRCSSGSSPPASSSSRSRSTRRAAETRRRCSSSRATLKESGHVDVVDVNDNPRARARMSGMMASATIERVVGIETIPHLTPRDSSIAGLESMLLGAHAEGIRNVLAVTGDPPEAGDYPGAQRRLRGRLDRALAGDHADERGRGLQRRARSTRRRRSSSASR